MVDVIIEQENITVNVGQPDNLDVNIGAGDGTHRHTRLSELNWSEAGHTIDTDIDMVNNDLDNLKDINFQDGGSVDWNDTDKTINVTTGLGPVIQVGQEEVTRVFNNTGGKLFNGKVVSPTGGISAEGIPEVDLISASLDDFAGVEALVVLTQDIEDQEWGFGTLRGTVRGADTSGYSVGVAYLSPTVAGDLTNTKPSFPDYPIRIGGVLNSDLTNGNIIVSIRGRLQDTFNNFWNGTIRETFDFRTAVVGGDIVGSLEPANGHDNLTMLFSDGFTVLDTNPADTIILTAGTDNIPQMNYVYIPRSTKVLTVSTSGFPTTEHARIAEVYLRSIATTDTDGALKNQNINDHIQSTNTDQGHLSHIGQRLRAMNAEWDTGAETSLSVSGGVSDVYVSNTSGKVFQLHEQTFPVLDMSTGDDIHIVNDPISPYKTTDNLNTITDDSDGDTLNNKWFSVVIWGVCNKTGELSHLMCNLPTGSYNSESNAINDALNHTNYNIPQEFKGTGFLMARFVMRKSGTTFTYNSGVGYLDLRGFVPNSTAGSGAGSSGITTFLGLTDTSSSYTGQAGLIATVNVGETALEFTEKTPLTTKGDLLTYDTDNARLPVGTNDQVLTADSTTDEGVAWKDAGGSFTRTVLFSGSAGVSTINLSEDINNFNWIEVIGRPGTGNAKAVVMSVETFKLSGYKYINENNNASVNINFRFFYATGTTITIDSGSGSMNLTQVVGIA